MNTQSFPTSAQSSDTSSEPDSPLPCLSASLFRSFPPERIGLNGEYDYDGLSKRVRQRIVNTLGKEAIANLALSQRGAMVILKGVFYDPTTLYELVNLALQTNGAVGVEVNGKTLLPPIDQDSLFSQILCLCTASANHWGKAKN